jgi:hypothetical protein
LRKEHLPSAEELADDVHPVHQRSFDDVERPRVLVLLYPRLLDVFRYVRVNALTGAKSNDRIDWFKSQSRSSLKRPYHKEYRHLQIFCVFLRDGSSNIS